MTRHFWVRAAEWLLYSADETLALPDRVSLHIHKGLDTPGGALVSVQGPWGPVVNKAVEDMIGDLSPYAFHEYPRIVWGSDGPTPEETR